jgi:HTH-type transcriptional regulator, glycine betaine synthesis regulator
MTEDRDASGAELFGRAMGLVFERFGLRPVLGKVWTALYLEDHPLDVDEIRARVDISTGTLSTAINELIELGFVHRAGAPGERRFFYRAETEMWPLITRLFRERERVRIVEIIDALRAAEAQFGAADTGSPGLGAQRAEKARHIISVAVFALDLLDAITARTKVEMKAAQKWLEVVSSRLGGEPLNKLRQRINARYRP